MKKRIKKLTQLFRLDNTEHHRFCKYGLFPKMCGSGGIQTHASEETGALNQHLRPLGHATSALNKLGAEFTI